MITFNNINWKIAIAEAQELAQSEGVSRFVNSFGGWALDANKQPVVFQVQVTVKDIGGDNTRTEMDYYFIPTTQPDQAIAIAKAIATYNFLCKELPTLEVQQELKIEPAGNATEAKDEASKEGQPEVQVSEDKTESTNTEQPKKKRTRKPKAEVVEQPKYEAYDNTKNAHKDALIALLDKEFVGWRDMGKDKTKAMSATLVGQSFLNENGVILESFKELLNSHVG
jgi:hypothetical protein